jgi:hypothetical protein
MDAAALQAGAPGTSSSRRYAPLLVGGSLALIGFLFWLTMRWSLFGLLVAAAPLLLWTWVRRPHRLKAGSAATCALAVVVAAVPVDIQHRDGDRLAIELKPILWGLPTPETMERVEPGSVVWGGCVLPLLNPPRYAVLVYW